MLETQKYDYLYFTTKTKKFVKTLKKELSRNEVIGFLERCRAVRISGLKKHIPHLIRDEEKKFNLKN